MSRKLHIYHYNEREVSTIDAPLSDVSWSFGSHGVMVLIDLASFPLLLLSSECIQNAF